MGKANEHRHGNPNFLHLGEVLHHMEGRLVAAYDWLSGPAMSKKEDMEHKLAESEPLLRVWPWGL